MYDIVSLLSTRMRLCSMFQTKFAHHVFFPKVLVSLFIVLFERKCMVVILNIFFHWLRMSTFLHTCARTLMAAGRKIRSIINPNDLLYSFSVTPFGEGHNGSSDCLRLVFCKSKRLSVNWQMFAIFCRGISLRAIVWTVSECTGHDAKLQPQRVKFYCTN